MLYKTFILVSYHIKLYIAVCSYNMSCAYNYNQLYNYTWPLTELLLSVTITWYIAMATMCSFSSFTKYGHAMINLIMTVFLHQKVTRSVGAIDRKIAVFVASDQNGF